MNKIVKAGFDAALKAIHEQSTELSNTANTIITNCGADTFQVVEDSQVECTLYSDVITTIAGTGAKMAKRGMFVAIHLKYLDFFFEEKQVRVFLILCNKRVRNDNRVNFAHIELWHADKEKELKWPKSKMDFDIMELATEWEVVGGIPAGFID